MKEATRNIRRVAALITVFFVFLTGYFCYAVSSYGNRWFASRSNTRIMAREGNIIAGTMADRNGMALSWSKTTDDRQYVADRDLRIAVSHLLGDRDGNVTGSLERRYARYLLGFENTFWEEIMRLFKGREDTGDSVMLTVDASAERAAYEALDGRSGSVCVIDYRTGEVICSVSSPGFDPEDAMDVSSLPNGALVNKTLQASYPPGTTFKIVTALCMLRNGMEDAVYTCEGHDEIDGVPVTCYHGSVHGTVDLEAALAGSCNCAFASWSRALGADKLTETAEALGFNADFLFPDCTLADSSFVKPESVYDLVWAGIGQSKTMITPLHACMIAGAVANDGVMMQPRFLLYAVSAEGEIEKAPSSRRYRRVMSVSEADLLAEWMKTTVEEGTGTAAAVDGLTVCGKTGTAEVDGEESHAWFVGFIEDDRYPFAIAVVAENAGSGGAVAAPIAGEVLRAITDR